MTPLEFFVYWSKRGAAYAAPLFWLLFMSWMCFAAVAAVAVMGAFVWHYLILWLFL